MSKRAIEYFGSGLNGNIEDKPFDMHCPLMRTLGNPLGLNYWKENCEYRQTLPEHKKTCYPRCKVSNVFNVDATSEYDRLDIAKRFLKKHEAGMTFSEVAESEEVAPSTVSKYIRMITNRPAAVHRKFDVKSGEIWLALKYEKGMASREIAKLYGCSYSTVNKYILLAQRARE